MLSTLTSSSLKRMTTPPCHPGRDQPGPGADALVRGARCEPDGEKQREADETFGLGQRGGRGVAGEVVPGANEERWREGPVRGAGRPARRLGYGEDERGQPAPLEESDAFFGEAERRSGDEIEAEDAGVGDVPVVAVEHGARTHFARRHREQCLIAAERHRQARPPGDHHDAEDAEQGAEPHTIPQNRRRPHSATSRAAKMASQVGRNPSDDLRSQFGRNFCLGFTLSRGWPRSSLR